MNFLPTSLPGAWLIHLDPKSDARGHFVRTFCAQEFSARGLHTSWPQCNVTLTQRRGMIRGLHWQADPAPEIKLIRCSRGAVWDVLVDLRPNSPTFGRWQSFELRADHFHQLYVPGGFAHGFQCLEDQCELHYQMSESYVPHLARGLRWDDPTLAIPWPIPHPELSDRDRSLPTFEALFPKTPRSPVRPSA